MEFSHDDAPESHFILTTLIASFPNHFLCFFFSLLTIYLLNLFTIYLTLIPITRARIPSLYFLVVLLHLNVHKLTNNTQTKHHFQGHTNPYFCQIIFERSRQIFMPVRGRFCSVA